MVEQFLVENPWILLVLLAWTIPWKIAALWRAARNNHKKWFGVIFIMNTLAILEIIYIFFFSKKKAYENKASGSGASPG